ncbi:MAG TPA: DNA replication/repair protein RecF [Actinomycetota bacterium]|nr:DNA replication/repair protein RecF [Actinomycetota bacterium]
MEILHLTLKDFRNYETADVTFDGGLNIVVGPNGHGKTNLLEAVHVMATMSSHRSATVGPMVRFDADTAIIRAQGKARARSVSVDAEIRRTGGVRVLVNKVPIERAEAASVISAVLFSPEDLNLTKGGPEERRRFLDQTCVKLRPLSGAERQEFERVLKQRNGVLKAATSNPRAVKHLEVWTEQLIKTGSVVARNRLELLSRITGPIQRRHGEVAATGQPVTLGYEASWVQGAPPMSLDGISVSLRTAVEASLPRDIERGLSLVGPHRDDIAIRLDDVDARTYASQGEQRSLALAMRLAERDILTEENGEEPILLLDDVFSELDEFRRSHLAELVEVAGQTIATTTSDEGLGLAGRRLAVDSGKVVPLE